MVIVGSMLSLTAVAAIQSWREGSERTVLEDPQEFMVPQPELSASPSSSARSSSQTSKATSHVTTASAPATSTSIGATVRNASGKPKVNGWYFGASGQNAADGSFARWLGQPLTLVSTWADTDDANQRTLPTLTSEYAGWTGAVDIAVGGTVLSKHADAAHQGENYAAAAAGAYDERWRAAAQVLAASRAKAVGPTFVRPFHEFNGDWYDNWVVTRENLNDYKAAFARYARILREAMPSVYISWSPNSGDKTGIPMDEMYPGDAVVDVIAPDYYDGWTDPITNKQQWDSESVKKDGTGNPVGPEAWRRYAEKHGKPLAFPEWGLNPSDQGGDHPQWIEQLNAWKNEHANTASWVLGEPIPATAAGKFLYGGYFNVPMDGKTGFTIYGHGANPQSEAVFPKLRWGTARLPQ